MNNKIVKWSFLTICLVLLTACPYQSKVAIDLANEKVDNALLGKWCKESHLNEKNSEFYEFTQHSENEYKITKNTYASFDSTYKQESFIAHINTIGENKFLNVKNNTNGDYLLYKIEYSNTKATLSELSENIDEEFKSSAELKAFVEQNMNLSFFYNRDEYKYVKR